MGVSSRPPSPSPGMEWSREGGSLLPTSLAFSGHGVEQGGWESPPDLPRLLRAWSGAGRVGVSSRPPSPSPGMEWSREGGSLLPTSLAFSGHGVGQGGWESPPDLPRLLRAWSGAGRVGVSSRPPSPSPGMEWGREGGSLLPTSLAFSGHGVGQGGWESPPDLPRLLRAWSGAGRVGVSSRPPSPSPGMEWGREGGSLLPTSLAFSGHGVGQGGWESPPDLPRLLRAWSGAGRVGVSSRPPSPSPGMEWGREGGSLLPTSLAFSGHGVGQGGWESPPDLPCLLRAWSGAGRVGVSSRPPSPSPGMEWGREGGSLLPTSLAFSGHGVEQGGWESPPDLPRLLRAWSGAGRVGVSSRPPSPSPGMEWSREGGSLLPTSLAFSGHGVEQGGWESPPDLPRLLRAWSGAGRVGVSSRPPSPSPGMEWSREGGSLLPTSLAFSGHGVEQGGWESPPDLPRLLRAWSGAGRVGVSSRPPSPSPGMEWSREGGSLLPTSLAFSGHGVEQGGWESPPDLPRLLRAWSGAGRVGVSSRPPSPSPGMEWSREGGSLLPTSLAFSGHGVEQGGWESPPDLPRLLRAWSGAGRVGVSSRPPSPSPGMEWSREGGSLLLNCILL